MEMIKQLNGRLKSVLEMVNAEHTKLDQKVYLKFEMKNII